MADLQNVAAELGAPRPEEVQGLLDYSLCKSRLLQLFYRVEADVLSSARHVRRDLAKQYATLHSASLGAPMEDPAYWAVEAVRDPQDALGPGERCVWLVPEAEFFLRDQGFTSTVPVLLIATSDEITDDALAYVSARQRSLVPFKALIELPLAVAYSGFIDEYYMTIRGLPQVRQGVAEALSAFGLDHRRLLNISDRIASAYTVL